MIDHLLFSLNSVRYGVDASAVLEIFWLPELSLVEEAPSYIAGVINLRGQILPVISLDQRFLRTQKQVLLTDQVIVLQLDGLKIGIMVSEVHDVVPISCSDRVPMPRYNHHTDTTKHFIAAEAKFNDAIWMLLDLANVINAPDLADNLHQELASTDLFLALPAVEHTIFQARARLLANIDDKQSAANQNAFAVVQLENEFYAIAISEVREFCHMRQFTPIPCCPKHIIGNMNLRGDILTLVDLRPALMLNRADDLTKVMVVEFKDLRVGVLVSEVLDVIYLSPAEHLPLPAYANELTPGYCSAALPYHLSIASLLDIKALLSSGCLEVNEHV